MAFSDSYIWAAGMSDGKGKTGVTAQSNMIFRARKDNPEQELEVYIVNFKGKSVGTNTDQIMKMVLPSDDRIALLS